MLAHLLNINLLSSLPPFGPKQLDQPFVSTGLFLGEFSTLNWSPTTKAREDSGVVMWTNADA